MTPAAASPELSSQALPPTPARALATIVLISTAVRLAAAFGVPILDDEAHYWVWSRHLMWGYPDHPPMIAGLVALSTRVFGDSVPAIRLMPVLLGAVSTLLIYVLTRRLFSPAAGLRAAVLFQVVPAFAASGIMAAPDAPLGTFWLLTMLLGWMATHGVAWAWPAAGVAAGLVVQSKLAGGAIVLSLAGFVLTSPAQRRWLRTPGPYLAVLAGAVVVSPLVWWNAQHGWATLRRALVQDPWVQPTTVVENVAIFVGAQLVYYAPLGFGLLVAALIRTAAWVRDDERFRYLAWSAATTLAVVLPPSLGALSKPHYTGPAFVAAAVAAAGLWDAWRARRLLRATVVTSAAFTLTALLLVSIPNPLSENFRRETQGWQEVGREVERLLPTLGPPGSVFVLAETYQSGSQLTFATGNRVPVVVPFRGFDLWEPPTKWIGRNGLFVDHLGGEQAQRLAGAFDRLGSPYVVPIRPGYQIFLYPGTGFRGLQ